MDNGTLSREFHNKKTGTLEKGVQKQSEWIMGTWAKQFHSKKSDQLGCLRNEVMGNPEVPTTATFPGPVKYKFKKMHNTQNLS